MNFFSTKKKDKDKNKDKSDKGDKESKRDKLKDKDSDPRMSAGNKEERLYKKYNDLLIDNEFITYKLFPQKYKDTDVVWEEGGTSYAFSAGYGRFANEDGSSLNTSSNNNINNSSLNNSNTETESTQQPNHNASIQMTHEVPNSRFRPLRIKKGSVVTIGDANTKENNKQRKNSGASKQNSDSKLLDREELDPKKQQRLVSQKIDNLNKNFIENGNNFVYPKDMYRQFFQTITSNIFRDIPFDPAEKTDLIDEDENINVGQNEGDETDELEASFPEWNIVNIFYKMLLDFLNSPSLSVNQNGDLAKANLEVCGKTINRRFIAKLLLQMNTKNFPERDLIKVILHKLYDLFINLRQYIRASMAYTFHRVIYEKHKYYGIPELLEISAAIISGLSKPVKLEHKEFLFRALIPLHVAESYGTFNLTLSYCLCTFLSKEPSHLNHVIHSVLKYWPKQVSIKETWFLDELEYILDQTFTVEQLEERTLVATMTRICNSLTSYHFQVSSRAAAIFENMNVKKLIEDHKTTTLPLILRLIMKSPYVELLPEATSAHNRLVSKHWNEQVRDAYERVWNILADVDAGFYNECVDLIRDELMEVKITTSEAILKSLEIIKQDANNNNSESTSMSTDEKKDVHQIIGKNYFPLVGKDKFEILQHRLRRPRNYYIELD